MPKIQIIIDDNKSLRGLTCDDILVTETACIDNNAYYTTLNFTANHVIVDESPNLISIPDEILQRIKNHNIDEEYQHAIKQTFKLNEKIESLKNQVRGYELRIDLLREEAELYEKVLDKICDEYPRVAAEVALELGHLDAACYYAEQANKEAQNNDGNN